MHIPYACSGELGKAEIHEQTSSAGIPLRRAHFVYEIDQCAHASKHKRSHHPLILVTRSKVAFDEEENRQRESGPRNVVLPIVLFEDQPYELHGETDPKEDVELDKTFENLMCCIHFLYATVSTQKLVHLPAEFVINFPAETNVRYLGSGYDGGDDVSENVHWYMQDPGRAGRHLLDFANFNDGI